MRVLQCLAFSECYTCLQTVQKAILVSDVQSKADKSPVTVADYGMFSLMYVCYEKRRNFAYISL